MPSEINEEPYQPVMYSIVKNKKQLNEKETLHEVQDGFIQRTERMMRQH
jgi:hypothetical protein